jgi:hypothetical protein
VSTATDVLTDFEDRLTNASLDLQLMDRIDLPAGVTSHRTARGIFVEVPATTNREEYRDQNLERVDEQVIVILAPGCALALGSDPNPPRRPRLSPRMAHRPPVDHARP